MTFQTLISSKNETPDDIPEEILSDALSAQLVFFKNIAKQKWFWLHLF